MNSSTRSTRSSFSQLSLLIVSLTATSCVPGSEDPSGPAARGGSGASTQGSGGSGGRSTSGGSGGVSGSAGSGGSTPSGSGGSTPSGSGGDSGSGTGGSSPGTGGRAPGTGGAGGGSSSGGSTGSRDGGATEAPPASPGDGKKFSFFVISIESIRKLSGSQNGFGGNLGGLTGADKICQDTAASAGAGHKTWKAFLSATKGGANGGPVHAIDRIGEGPWYDFHERLIARTKADLVMVRPAGDPQAVSDLANERGQAQKPFGDNHDTVTGSNRMGMLMSMDPATTCQDWTSSSATGGRAIMAGHSWSRVGRQQWIQEHTVPGCAPGVNLRDNYVAPGNCIGCSGGYGGFYCFALQP